MQININKDVNLLEFGEKLQELAETDVKKCYQCGKCTAGCPLNYLMDISPSQVIRFCQLGMKEKVLNSRSIWYCVFCDTCSTRCPQGVDIKGVMDASRRTAVRQKIKPKADIRALEKSFAGSIYSFGRVFEPGVVGGFNLRSGKLLHDVFLFPLLLLKRKICLIPHWVRSSEVRGVFKRARRKERGL